MVLLYIINGFQEQKVLHYLMSQFEMELFKKQKYTSIYQEPSTECQN